MTPERFRGKKICLVTNGHLSSNPRIVKEADALAGSGAHTQVVGLQTLPGLQRFDLDLARDKRWRYRAIDVSRGAGPWTYRARAAREYALRLLPPSLWKAPGVIEGAFSRFTSALGVALENEPAEMYIAHNLAALPAAAAAARRFGARLGFDAEDYHAGELPDAPANQIARQRVLAIEDRYLPMCQHLTAASPGIAELYARRYARPVATILNVFSLAERPPVATAPSSGTSPVLYWFSQTIGPGRGLEQMLGIVGRMRTRPVLQLRGTWAAGFRDRLAAVAEREGVSAQLRFLDRAAPDEMVSLAAGHSLGLAIEIGDILNRTICLSNKIFTYLLAGVPVVLSDTSAHRRLAVELGEAARIIDLDRIAEAAEALDAWLLSGDRLARSRATAWDLGQHRFNWDNEKEIFLASVATALESSG